MNHFTTVEIVIIAPRAQYSRELDGVSFEQQTVMFLPHVLCVSFVLQCSLAGNIPHVHCYSIDVYRFEPFERNDDYDYQCYEVTVIFTTSAFQFILMAVVFAKGAPYRKSMFTNCKSLH